MSETLQLEVNPQNDIIIKAVAGLKFLGVGILLKKSTLNLSNLAGYSDLIRQLESGKYK